MLAETGGLKRAADIALNLAALGFLGLLLLPSSAKAVTLAVGVDPHPISFFIGPALYRYDPALIPNVDFMPQYGVGAGGLFSFLLSTSPFRTFQSADLVTIGSTVLFVWAFYLLACWLLQSRVWALVLAVVAVIMNSYGPMPFRAPSGWPTFYPLLALYCLAFAAYWSSRLERSRRIWLIVAGSVAGASLFWATEPGLSQIVVGLICYVLLSGESWARRIIGGLAFLASASFVFILLSFVVFGPAVISGAYYVDFFNPLILYGSGFGDWPVNWSSAPEFLFNVIIPLLLTATVTWGLSCGDESHSSTATRRKVLVLASLLALAQLTKYWNMSLAAVWLSNAYLPLLVFTFWIRAGIGQFGGTSQSSRSGWLRAALPAAALGLALFYVLGFKDPRMDTAYGSEGYNLYPSAIGSLLARYRPSKSGGLPFSSAEVASADVAMIEKLVAPGDPAYLVSSRDWAYLLRAKRAPGFPFIPSTMTPLEEQISQPLAKAKVLFIDTGKGLWSGYTGGQSADMMQMVQQEISHNFRELGRGKDLVSYGRLH